MVILPVTHRQNYLSICNPQTEEINYIIIIIIVLKDIYFTEKSSPFLEINVNYNYQFSVLTEIGH